MSQDRIFYVKNESLPHALLEKRMLYGGRKGRSAKRRLLTADLCYCRRRPRGGRYSYITHFLHLGSSAPKRWTRGRALGGKTRPRRWR